MKTINYSAKALPDWHLILPEEIIEKFGLGINSRVCHFKQPQETIEGVDYVV
jgi:hypothetical protein